MIATATFTCDTCECPVSVEIQVPAGTTLADVARDLEAIDFESHVLHDLSEHGDLLVTS